MNRKKVTLAIGILSMNLLLMSGAVVGSAIAAIAQSFPQEPISKVQMLSTIPQLGQIVATLLFTWLTYKITKKSIGLLAVAAVAISGLIPLVYNTNLNMILACMVALGFGIGLISNVAPVLLQEHFEGEERATVMGWSLGFINIGMMGFTAIGGVLGGVDWRNLFWVYALAILIFIVVFFMVPKDTKATEETASQPSVSFLQTVKELKGFVYVILLITLITSLCITLFMANQSIILAEKGNGTAYTAMVTAIGTIGGIATGFGLKYIRKMTKNDTMAWGFVAFALSFACVIFFANPVMHVIGNMFSGMGIVMVNATIPYELSILANRRQFPIVIAMNTFVSAIAGFATPLIIAAARISAGETSFFAGIVISLVVAVILLVTRLGSQIQKKSSEAAAEHAANTQ